ncbi:16510_t:CDS:2 [Acaulospora colombiana]|uniref:16510_t:CDS:1 n=1 Tax=Acaulospora colombiana TaxID=27376 RepID=A0ACA9KPI5_9GLOM|nr:16510_t:CDS:2 [Acaulospora colombiana]
MLLQLGRDLQNIHDANLVHRDLHSGNVLVDSITCIADLGQSRNVETLQASTEVNGVMPYVAPEVLREQPYTKAADIYSFGIIMWEFTSFQLPFPECPHDIDLVLSICGGLRPRPIEGTPSCYVELMQQCWDSDPTKRPTAGYIVNALQNWFQGSDEDIVNQFKAADEIDSVRERSQPVHQLAFYTSRRLPTIPIVDTLSHASSRAYDMYQMLRPVYCRAIANNHTKLGVNSNTMGVNIHKFLAPYSLLAVASQHKFVSAPEIMSVSMPRETSKEPSSVL